jgi:hypothetical protein
MKRLIIIGVLLGVLLSSSAWGWGIMGMGGVVVASDYTLEVSASSTCIQKDTNATWDTIHDDTSGSAGTNTGVERTAGGNYTIYRTHVRFDCTDLPASFTITGAYIELYPTVKEDSNSKTIIACDSSYDGTCSGNEMGACTIDSPTQYGSSAIAGITINQYNNIALSSFTNILDSATVQYCIRGQVDVEDSATGLDNGEKDYVTLDTTTNVPKLHITYTIP